MKKIIKWILISIVASIILNFSYIVGCAYEAKGYNVVIEGYNTNGDGFFTVRSWVGSGVIVDHCGLIITAGHCVKNATSIRVTLPNGKKYTVTEYYKDPNNDVGILRIPTCLPNSTTLADSNDLSKYDFLYNVGNSWGIWDNSVNPGFVHRIHFSRNMLGDCEFIFARMIAQPGCSGGGVYHYRKLVGIVVMGRGSVSFIVPSNVIRDCLKRSSYSYSD